MADVITKTRTNYFSATDPEKIKGPAFRRENRRKARHALLPGREIGTPAWAAEK